MTKRVGRTEQLTARPVRSCTPMGALVVNFLRQVSAIISTMEPVTAHKMGEISLALITTAMGELISPEDNGQSWSRDKRKRDTQDVQMLPKHRWEIVSKDFIVQP